MYLGKRFIFGIAVTICASITMIIFRWGVSDLATLKFFAETYAKLVGGILALYTLAQSFTDYKKNGGGNAGSH